MKCNLIQGIKVITGVPYTDIDDCTDIAYFKDLEKLIPIYNEKYNKRKEENFRICDENEFRKEELDYEVEHNPDCFPEMYPGSGWDYEDAYEMRKSNREWMESEEAEILEEECKDVKINEMHAYDKNSRHTRVLLQSIQLNKIS